MKKIFIMKQKSYLAIFRDRKNHICIKMKNIVMKICFLDVLKEFIYKKYKRHFCRNFWNGKRNFCTQNSLHFLL